MGPFRLRSLSVWLGFALVGVLLLDAASASAARGNSHATPAAGRKVKDLEFSARQNAAKPGNRARPGRAGRLRFAARGRGFDLDLDENLELLERLPEAAREQLRARHELYAGRVVDHPGSWVRLTRTAEGWSGLVHDGTELLALESERGSLVLYPASEVEIPGTCGLQAASEAPSTFEALAEELAELPPTLATRELEITLVGDVALSNQEADPEGASLAVLNAVDGLYSDQVGVSLRVGDVVLLQEDAGLTSNDAGSLLTQLSNLTRSGAIQNPGLVHLMTGRNLDGSTVGIAYLGVVCNSGYGVGISELLSSLAASTVLVAHEIGHNAGAPHDDQGGSVCSSTGSGFIMAPYLNSGAEQFSACSLDEMADELQGASCLEEVSVEPLPACSNGLDDDGDGLIDYGEDPNCGSAEDDLEQPPCSDGLDNDADGLIDFPEDPECLNAGQWSEGTTSCGIGFEIVGCLLPITCLRRRRKTRRTSP